MMSFLSVLFRAGITLGVNLASFSFVFVTIFQFGVLDATISVSCPCSSTNVEPQILDYYWRDYVGIIPHDALQGGTDKTGNPTYVGQAYIRSLELLPVIIFPGSKFANTTAHVDEVTTDKNIKILCAKDKGKFEWIFVKDEETNLLPNRHLVLGGSEIGHDLKIGRVLYNGQTIVGKVFSPPVANSGLWIPYDGKPVRFVTFEILTYNQQKITNWSQNLQIDIRCH